MVSVYSECTMTCVLNVKELTTKLKVGRTVLTAVDRISFSLEKGKTLALVGESGCGKSLTALSILRILPRPPALPSEGQVLFGETDLLKMPEREMRKIRGSKIAMIFQDPMSALNPVYSILNQLMEVAEVHLGLYEEEAEERCLKALEEVGIEDPVRCLEAYPHQLSGGMKQRVMIAMALMCEPDVLIADEPTTALDVTIQKQVLDLMKSLQEKTQMSILLITHDMGVVAQMADDSVVMYATQMMEQGSVRDIFQQKSHPYTEALFRSLPSADVPKGQLKAIRGTVPQLSELPKGCYFHPRCPYAMPVCRSGEVPLFPGGGEPGHLAKCWLRDPEKMNE